MSEVSLTQLEVKYVLQVHNGLPQESSHVPPFDYMKAIVKNPNGGEEKQEKNLGYSIGFLKTWNRYL